MPGLHTNEEELSEDLPKKSNTWSRGGRVNKIPSTARHSSDAGNNRLQHSVQLDHVGCRVPTPLPLGPMIRQPPSSDLENRIEAYRLLAPSLGRIISSNGTVLRELNARPIMKGGELDYSIPYGERTFEFIFHRERILKSKPHGTDSLCQYVAAVEDLLKEERMIMSETLANEQAKNRQFERELQHLRQLICRLAERQEKGYKPRSGFGRPQQTSPRSRWKFASTRQTLRSGSCVSPQSSVAFSDNGASDSEGSLHETSWAAEQRQLRKRRASRDLEEETSGEDELAAINNKPKEKVVAGPSEPPKAYPEIQSQPKPERLSECKSEPGLNLARSRVHPLPTPKVVGTHIQPAQTSIESKKPKRDWWKLLSRRRSGKIGY